MIAGLNVLRLIAEPTSAAMAAGLCDGGDGSNVLVFDWGGGTFDITVLTATDGCIDVQASKGDMNLGGRDIDELLVNHCLEEFKK